MLRRPGRKDQAVSIGRLVERWYYEGWSNPRAWTILDARGRSPMCGRVASPLLLGRGAGGRSPGYLYPELYSRSSSAASASPRAEYYLERTIQPVCANLIVETGHFPSCPLIEIRRPCNSSSQTPSTVPAIPSVRITALPTRSDWACSNSLRIADARTFTDGMGIPESGLDGSVFASESCASRDHCAAKGCQRNPDPRDLET
jgi:hypothetical protein